jgi:hypothetical protein
LETIGGKPIKKQVKYIHMINNKQKRTKPTQFPLDLSVKGDKKWVAKSRVYH